MLRIYKISIGLLLAASVTAKVSAFSLGGALETWQTPDLNYGVDTIPRSGDAMWIGEDFSGSKNLGEEYRLNTPKLTYGFDYDFQTYFGSAGMAAVDKAMAILNALPAASSASADLSEFATESVQQINPTASALFLFDMKSMVLSIMLEHMGLMDDSHVFDLRGRTPVAGGGPCDFTYGVINRNFDPITYEPTFYVNGIEYHYQITDLCSGGGAFADAVEEPVNTTDMGRFGTVASWRKLRLGGFYNQISRDDMGGLRYIYRSQNYNNELLPPGATATIQNLYSTSPWNPVVIGTNSLATNASPGFTNSLFCGVEKIQFIRDTNTLPLRNTFNPVTLKYTQLIVVSNKLTAITVTRKTPQPDIIFRAADISNPANGYSTLFTRSLTMTNNSVAGTGGPGNVMPQMEIVFNKAGLLLINQGPADMTYDNAFVQARWASFDGTTNDPVIFPKGSSIRDVENQVLGQ